MKTVIWAILIAIAGVMLLQHFQPSFLFPTNEPAMTLVQEDAPESYSFAAQPELNCTTYWRVRGSVKYEKEVMIPSVQSGPFETRQDTILIQDEVYRDVLVKLQEWHTRSAAFTEAFKDLNRVSEVVVDVYRYDYKTCE